MSVLDTPPIQRLRYVRQLGHAFLVFPGATHSRFEHALGAYHLTGRALSMLDQQGALPLTEAERLAVRLAALLHDIGHYPFSHGLEEAGFAHHESLGVAKLSRGPLGEALHRLGGPALGAEIGALIEGRSTSPLQGLISGTLDVDRLLASITLVETEPGGRGELGVMEKGISALESMLFSKYQMYRNVYWHHAVRAATCMFKRAVRATLRTGGLSADGIAEATDGALVERLLQADPTGLARAVHERRLFKRALDLPGSDVPDPAASWLSDDAIILERVEDAVARELGLEPGTLLIDYPERERMLSVDLPLRTRSGAIERLTDRGRAGHLGLPRIAAELYQSARRLRVFSADGAIAGAQRLVSLAAMSGDEVRERLDRGTALLT
jgi:HD superfamily phosphohydrolase